MSKFEAFFIKLSINLRSLSVNFLFSGNANAVETFNSLKLEADCIASGKTKSACKKEVYGWDLNDYLKDGYKITSENFVNHKGWLTTIFVLKKRGTVVTCKVDHNKQETTCREP